MCIRDSHKPLVVFVDEKNKISHIKNYEKHGLLVDQPVSYTHLDVYKRQILVLVNTSNVPKTISLI